MSNLEDKLLGEKLEYYCSSDEEESTINDSNEIQGNIEGKAFENKGAISSNTGPKGVIEDWQRFKELQKHNFVEKEHKLVEIAKKCSMCTSSTIEDEKNKENNDMDKELEELMSEEFLQKFQKIRMAEILNKNSKSFGKVFELTTSDEFIDCIESENPNTTVIIHIYDNSISSCRHMNLCLESLSKLYKTVKFAKVLWATTGMTREFKKNGLPALLVYTGQELKISLIRITDDLTDDFFASDLENLLIERGAIVERISSAILD